MNKVEAPESRLHTVKFEYIDDKIPEIESVLPFRMYADTPARVTVVALNLPDDLLAEEISIGFELASSKTSFGALVSPSGELMMDRVNSDGLLRTRLSFHPEPFNDAEACIFDAPCIVTVELAARGRSAFLEPFGV